MEVGLEHFSSQIGQLIFEIYPQTAKAESTTGTRLGFQVSDLDSLLIRLEYEDVSIVSKPIESEWGRRSIVIDPDGHKVELTQSTRSIEIRY